MTDTSKYFVEALETLAAELDVCVSGKGLASVITTDEREVFSECAGHVRRVLDGAPQGKLADLLDEYIAALERACALGRELAPHIDDAQVALFRAREWRAKRGALHEEAEALLDGGGMEDHDAD